MKVYCAAPMRGYPQGNHPVINAAVRQLREAGHEVFSPAEQDLRTGKDPADHDAFGNDPAYLRKALAEDLAWVTGQADAVVVLPGWERSKGAQAEVHAAIAVGVPVYGLYAFLAGALGSPVTWETLHPSCAVSQWPQ